MFEDDLMTIATVPNESYTLQVSFDDSITNVLTESNFIDIEFPKSRIIRLSKESNIEFTANYGKIDEQMRIFNSNYAINI